ncbi:MAG: type I-E CRISPR-associated protein Cas5/CasD [Chloroflexota bacterium]|nr:type I-E CRISPR-associated protein Cas5/CasD [Chloroflexota bacterium]
MKTLLMRLAGPMQSWGTQSQFRERDTGLEPSKSGVIGLLCAALGRPREESVADLAALEMGVRVEHEGALRRDYQTAGGWHRRADAGYGVAKADGKPGGTVLSDRYYLADADFLVGLSGEDEGILHMLNDALAAPRWSLCLGRKAFVPAISVRLPDDPASGDPSGIVEGDVRDILKEYPWLGYRRPSERKPDQLRLVLESTDGDGARRQDVPVSFALGRREFRVRYVETEFVSLVSLRQPRGGADVSLETDAQSA